MIESLSPIYYAPNVTIEGASLSGFGFPLIPDDAVAILSRDNNQPLMYLNSTDADYIMTIATRDANNISFVAGHVTSHVQGFYLGAIVSFDRQTIYWVNDSKPLP